MNILLISMYELGRQPFGLASPAAWLRAAGHKVTCADLSIEQLPLDAVENSDLVAFYVPMHTATRLAGVAIGRVRELKPSVPLCCFGLYAPLNADYLRRLGVRWIIGGEFEAELAALAGGLSRAEPQPDRTLVPLERLQFVPPDRSSLPMLSAYPKLVLDGQKRVVGYTESSRGCKHECRHCPIVPVYQRSFRVVQAEVVLQDIRNQVAGGAEHITFGDPDFFNGPAHARRILHELHAEFPHLTYDVTVKVEHLLRQRLLLADLHDTGCLFITTAVESVDDAVLHLLEKGHTRADFIEAANLARDLGLTLAPTFIPFTPWTTRAGYQDLLRTVAELDLVQNVAPVQWGIRLLIPSSSRLLELEDIQRAITRFDPEALAYHWAHSDPDLEALGSRIQSIVRAGVRCKAPRLAIFRNIWHAVMDEPLPDNPDLMPRTVIPYMEEPWFC